MRDAGRSDAELMRAFARRDPGAAEDLYSRFSPRIFGLGLVMLGNPGHAEDLVQDTFVKLWRNVDSFQPTRGSLDTWVLLMARSLAIDSIRRRVLEARILATHHEEETSPEPGPDVQAETMDLADRAKRAMASLSPSQRAALELAYFGGKTSAEVAELEGVPVATAKTRIRSGLIKLREAMEVEHEL